METVKYRGRGPPLKSFVICNFDKLPSQRTGTFARSGHVTESLRSDWLASPSGCDAIGGNGFAETQNRERPPKSGNVKVSPRLENPGRNSDFKGFRRKEKVGSLHFLLLHGEDELLIRVSSNAFQSISRGWI